MGGMRKLSYEFKLPGRSIPEVYERFNQSLTRHQGSGRVKFSGRKLSAEALVNAVMLHFLDMPHDAQAGIVARYVPAFEAMLAEEGDPQPQAPPAAANGHPGAPGTVPMAESDDRPLYATPRPKGGERRKKG